MDTLTVQTIVALVFSVNILYAVGENICFISSESFQEQFCRIREEVWSVKNQTEDIFYNNALLRQLESDVAVEAQKIEEIHNRTREIHMLMEQLNNLTATCSVCSLALPTLPTAPTSCDTDPCQNGGTCIDAGDDYYCLCPSEFEGKKCDVVSMTDSCLLSPCKNNGTCVSGNSSYSCSCNSGYTGIHCEILIDHCSSGPCKNNATCNNFSTGFNCTCTPDHLGVTCDVEVGANPCDKNPCNGEAKCEQTAGSTLQCVCPETDETKADPCKKPVYVMPFGTCCIQDTCRSSTDCSASG